MTATVAVAGVNLRRLARDRVGLFFTFVLPVLIVVLLGAAIPRGDVVVAVADLDGTERSRALVAALDADGDLDVRTVASEATARDRVRRAKADAAVVVPAGYQAALDGGDEVTMVLLLDPTSDTAAAARTAVQAAVAGVSSQWQAARLVVAETGFGIEDALARAGEAAKTTSGPAVVTRTAGAEGFRSVTTAEYAAIGELVLFVFLIALTGAGDLVETRRLGVSRRSLVSPVRAAGVVAGEGLGRFGIAALQCVLIVGGTSLLFGVAWGAPAGVVLVLAAFALLATAVSLLAASLVRSPEQATSLGPVIGIGLGMLGGCMWPLGFVPDALASVGRLTPHAWAMDALVALMGEGAGAADVLAQVGVLLAMTAVVAPLAVARFRRGLTG